jgi:hypothetical protein
MGKTNVTKRVTATILSMSLLTVMATLLAGLLATIEWNYAFLVYLMDWIILSMFN